MRPLNGGPAPATVRGCCPLDCQDVCSWDATVEDGVATKLRGAREHPFTAGALCGKVNRYLDTVYGEGRLLHPMVRVGPKGEGRFARVGWDEALDRVADGFRRAIDEHGPESLLPYYSGGTMGLVQGVTMPMRLFGALGASRLGLTICSSGAQAALEMTMGGFVGPDPEDLVHAGLVLLWGVNPISSNVHSWKFFNEARRRGARIVAIDPLRSDTAERCDEHIAPLPGTDGALALGVMHHVRATGRADLDWLGRHTTGWEAFARRLDEWTPERAAAVCGLPTETVVGLAERVATTRPTAIRLGLGLQRHGGAAAAVRAISAIPAVTGDWRHLGGGVVCAVHGHSPLQRQAAMVPPDLARPAARTVNMSRLAEALTELDDPPIAALMVLNANPAASVPDQLRVRAGLAREDLFTVVAEQRLTDTTDFADVVLPATTQLEHEDLHLGSGHHYTAWNAPAIEPLGECLPNTEIIRRIARRLGVDHPRLRDSDVEIAAQFFDSDELRSAGITLDRVREAGWLRVSRLPAGTAPFRDGGFPTASGTYRFVADDPARAGGDPLIGYVPPAEAGDAAHDERAPLVLLSPAARFFMNTTFAGSTWHRSKVEEPTVHLHPSDVAARGLRDGDEVRVHNDRGAFVARVASSDRTRPGVAFTFKGYWSKHQRGRVGVNATTAERDSDVGAAPTFHDNRVEVTAL